MNTTRWLKRKLFTGWLAPGPHPTYGEIRDGTMSWHIVLDSWRLRRSARRAGVLEQGFEVELDENGLVRDGYRRPWVKSVKA